MAGMAKNILNGIKLTAYGLLCAPHFFVYFVHPKRAVIRADIRRWLKEYQLSHGLLAGMLFLLSHYKEFRNLFYYRVGPISFVLNLLCRKMSSLYLTTPEIGEGLFIQHGFATVVAAKSIGKNCWINQQVTIGFSNNNECPVLEDNVTVNAGAKVIGGITIGSNSQIGANAVVVKNVPADCVVVGIPAYIIKRNGKKVKEPL
jgi:serine O-acetyltransferase